MDTGTGRVDESVFAGAPVCGYYRAVAIVRWRGRTTAFPSVKKAAMAMSRSQVASFNVACTRILRADGSIDGDLPDWARDRGELVRLYRAMVLARTFDAKAIALQRTGRLGTYASSLGQEAVAVGVAAAMQQRGRVGALLPRAGRDALARRHARRALAATGAATSGAALGPSPRRISRSACRSAAMRRMRPGSPWPSSCAANRAWPCASSATAPPRRATSYEAMNLAGRVAPAGGVRDQQQRLGDLGAAGAPERGRNAGAEGDRLRLRGRAGRRQRRDRRARGGRRKRRHEARAGGGPSLIEALTYRLGDHTTADDASRYRDDTEVGARWKEEPIARLRHHLVARHAWGKREEEEVLADMRRCRSTRPSRPTSRCRRSRRRACSSTCLRPCRSALGRARRAARGHSRPGSGRDAGD